MGRAGDIMKEIFLSKYGIDSIWAELYTGCRDDPQMADPSKAEGKV